MKIVISFRKYYFEAQDWNKEMKLKIKITFLEKLIWKFWFAFQ